jgi:hypothetical protein
VEAEIRKLGLRVESEQMEAQDVTRQYVDQQVHLRNLRAQEVQYLTILKQAKTVKDTLDVSEKLNGVRGEIEQQQAEFEALSKQVETVAITVSLHSEAEANVFGLHWRPLYELKLAMVQGLEGLADYATAMFSFVFYPSICRRFCCRWRRSLSQPRWVGKPSTLGCECYSPGRNLHMYLPKSR